MKIVVTIPTYNERENIGRLIPALQEVFRRMHHEMRVLVVDDASPDGTAFVVQEMADRYGNVHMITGVKEGLGSAYVRGMAHAIGPLTADAVMEMDADFSHKPEDVPRLVRELDHYDFVIGSRYVPGGKLPDNWPLMRRWNSRCGNLCARIIAGIPEVRDTTAGFRAIKADVLRNIHLAGLRVKGYSFQIRLLHEAIRNGARVKEVPVEFVDRVCGTSKLGLSDILEFLLSVWQIRLSRRASRSDGIRHG